jgi:hypothetical protein
MNSDRRLARVAGVLFILATVAGLLGSALTDPILGAPDYLAGISLSRGQVTLGALLSFVAAVASASIAISLYPVLKKHNEGLALGAVGFRLIEGVFYIVSATGLLSLVTLSQEFVRAGAPSASYFQTLGTLIQATRDWAGFGLAVIAFCLGALMYYFVFYQSRLIPRWLSGWGSIGAALLLSVVLWKMFGEGPVSISGSSLLLVLPIFLQEMVLAVWLIVKGFNSSAIPSESAKPYQGSRS